MTALNTQGVTKMYCSPVCSAYAGHSSDLLNRKCSSPFLTNCARGEYMSQNICEKCPQSCYECTEQGCVSCSSNYYLKNSECLPKSLPQNRIEVQILLLPGEYSPSNPPQSSDGSPSHPFRDLRDALTYANERAAPFTSSQIIIHMARGLHFISLRAEADSYSASQSDLVSRDYNLTLKPLLCGSMGVYDITLCQEQAYLKNSEVTIINKIGAYFYFDVPASLLVQDISFDGLDSLGSWDEECLANEERTCSYNPDTRSVESLINKQNGEMCCSKPQQNLDYCNFNHPTSLFRIKYSAAHQLRAPKSLRIQRAIFSNLFYDLNSLIEIPREGAQVSILNSTFQEVSMCGAIISNSFTLPVSQPERRFGASSDDHLALIENSIHNHEYERSLVEGGSFDPFIEDTYCHSSNKDRTQCYMIQIEGCSFLNFDFFFEIKGRFDSLLSPYAFQRPAVKYANGNNLLRASVIQLQNYEGTLDVYGSSFENIKLSSPPSFNQTYYEWTQPVRLNQQHLLASQLTGLKTEMPVVITNSSGLISFAHNNVTATSGTKGFLHINLKSQFIRPAVIHNNRFEGNAGFVYSGVLNLRSTYNSQNREVNSQNELCGGFWLNQNQFFDNIVCPVPPSVQGYEFNGLIKLSCVLRNQDISLQNEVYSLDHTFWNSSVPLIQESSFLQLTLKNGENLQIRRDASSVQLNEFRGNLIGEKSSLILSQEVPFIHFKANRFQATKDLVLSFDQQNFTHLGFASSGNVARQPGSLSSTGALISVMGGLGFVIQGEILGPENWKFNLDQNKYASFLYAERVRGNMTIADLEVTTPPINICNERALQMPAQNRLRDYCNIKYGGYIIDSNTEPLLRFKAYSDLSYEGSSPQTEIAIQNCTFQNFHTNMPEVKALIDLHQHLAHKVSLRVENSLFRNIYQREYSSLFSLEQISSTFTNCTFSNIGIIWWGEGSETLFTFGVRDKSISSEHHFTNIQISEIYVHGFIFDLSNTLANFKVLLYFTNIEVSDSTVNRGIVRADTNFSYLLMQNWLIRSIQLRDIYTRENSFFYLKQINDVDIVGMECECSFRDNNCMLIYAEGIYTNLTISDSRFTQIDSGYYFESDVRSPIHADIHKLNLNGNVFENFMKVGYLGGIFNLQIEANFHDRGSIYRNNKEGEFGGVFYFRGISYCEFSDSRFEGNSAKYGGAIFMTDYSLMILNRVHFEENYASKIGGALYATHSSAFKMIESVFLRNEAGDKGSAIYTVISSRTLHHSEIRASRFEENGLATHSSSTLFAIFNDLRLIDVTFLNNYSLKGTTGIYTTISTLKLSGCFFDSHYAPAEENSLTASYLTIRDESDVTILDSLFQGSREDAPVIQLFGKSRLSVTNATFFNNTHFKSPTILANSYSHFEISESLFDGNGGFPVGQVLLQHSSNTASIRDTRFLNGLKGDAIQAVSVPLSLSNVTIAHKRYNPKLQTGLQMAVSCILCLQIEIANSEFRDMEVDSVISLENMALQKITAKAWLHTNSFKNVLFRSDGGGVAIKDQANVKIEDSLFQNITGDEGRGAGVFIGGEYSQNVSLIRNTFEKNRARIGGAFYYEFHRPQLANNVMSLNQAAEYGDHEAGYPVRIALISEQLATDILSTGRLLSQVELKDSLKVTGQRSGDYLTSFYLVAVDYFGEISSTVQSQLYFQIRGRESSSYAPMVTNSRDVKSEQGIFNVSNVRVVAEPGKAVDLIIKANEAFDMTLPDVRLNANPVSGQIQFVVEIQFALCQPGYYFTANGECLFCEEFSYSFKAPSSPSACMGCPSKAFCFGGTQIGPRPTYWRANEHSVNFYSCINPNACLGSSLTDYDPQGTCAEGYRGVLCSQCQNGFTKDSTFHCSRCPQFWQNILILTAISLFSIFIIVLIVKGSLNSVQSKNNPCAVYFKILISHLQLIYLTSTFDLSWPKEFYSTADATANIQDRLFSLECFMQNKSKSYLTPVAATAARFYISLLISLLSPPVLAAVTFLIWFIVLRRSSHKVWGKSLASIIIILFIIHPSMTNTVFKAFHCTKIEDDSRLVEEMDQVCWHGSHLYWSLFGSLPALLLWILGIPAFAWCSMHSKRDYLHHKDVKQKYGFLYKGFKPSAYFWECVIMYKKVGLNFISVFLQSVGTIVQAMVVFVFIAFFMILTSRHQPYLSRKLNELEFFSLLTLSITFYCGIFFLSARDPTDMTFVTGKDYQLNEGSKWFFFVCIVFSNFAFLLLWLVRFCGDLREFTRERYKKLYLCLFLCKRKELFRLENKIAHTDQVNEEIIQTIEKLENLLKNIKNLYIQKKQIPQKAKLEAYLLRTTLELTKMRASEKKFFVGGSMLKESYVGEWKERARNKVPQPPPPSGNHSETSVCPEFRLTTNNDCMSIHMVEEPQPRRLVPRSSSSQSRMLKASQHRISLRSRSGRDSESSLVTRRISFASAARRNFTCQNTLAQQIEEDNMDSEQRLNRNFEELVGQGRSNSLSTFNLQSSSSRVGSSETPLNILIESPSNQRTERAYSKFKIKPRVEHYEASSQDVSEGLSHSKFHPQRQIFDFRMNHSSELINSYSVHEQRVPIRRTEFLPPKRPKQRSILRPRQRQLRPKLHNNYTENEEKILAQMFESDADYSMRSQQESTHRKHQHNQI